MSISPKELENAVLVISTVRLSKNGDSEACECILQLGLLLGRNKVK